VSKTLAWAAWALMGWRFEGNFPDIPKAVVIVAPHTSNWDFLVGVVAMFAIGVRVQFLGKHTLFRWPLGVIMRWLGGIAVDRRSASGVVEQIVRIFKERSDLLLVIAPEGTRGQVTQWKTGFYHIASGTGLPIVPISFDYPTRLIRIGDPFDPTGNEDSDIRTLQALLHQAAGKREQ
jgi:1-acyl-sn-glycerol-3-phosphate acyltransferase